jgi:hypothetical protein
MHGRQLSGTAAVKRPPIISMEPWIDCGYHAIDKRKRYRDIFPGKASASAS